MGKAARKLHQHDSSCGHTAMEHNGHTDYLDHGYLQHPDGLLCGDGALEVSDQNPDHCSPCKQPCSHVHGPGCGHEMVRHGDHVCYLVDGRLHHPHDGHCDDHGPVELL